MSISVYNGWVLTMAEHSEVIENGYVFIEGDRIGKVGTGTPPAADTVINARGGIIMPGMVNAHTHLAMALFRSLADDRADRLRNVLFPLESRAVTPYLVYHATRHALLELIEGGVTTFADMYYFEEESARATREFGLRGVLGETIVNFPAPDEPEPYGGLARTRTLTAAWRDDPLIT
ncbi:MAG: amidohydrolase family protein, partial [Spirochaeta sp.]|nr:amidohydrolase family protein [Spirochaeta sp.]